MSNPPLRGLGNVRAGSPEFLSTIINLNKPAQPHNRNQYQPDFINVKFGWGGAGLLRLFVRFEKFCRTHPYGFYFNNWVRNRVSFLATGEILLPPLARIWSLSANSVVKLKIVKKMRV
ncbi:hypothetical protein A19Y_1922 [Planktothrix agardhii NIVA-CYA 126/8]|uniref:Uncharacterized protein n=1 Tax=Planktothrix agardhii (strain NIVA-CYA 126/8) TaxID=388467 RepID=A0A073CFL3_PLAA1|nr:hypothetical protein A19Y_1922 [Planktothrix agardhii NIVA-CYA 126/8]